MVKRKVSSSSKESHKKAKKQPESNGNEKKNKQSEIDFGTPEKVLASLLGSNSLEDFTSKYWEKKPLLVERDDSSFYGSLFTMDDMKSMLKEEEMYFETDINVCRYVNKEKELLNEKKERITEERFNELMEKEKATFQVHQPQRYSENLWKLMEKMETYFGNLVGSNVYITPASSQGLAPHCDDVEIFVLQLEGKKTWKIYEPMVKLSRDYTQDLIEEDIGKPIMEHTLQPGDLLYFPRGYIHQAKTTDDDHSMHISISTYHQNTWGDFLNHAVSIAIENALEDEVTIRSGLPINYASFLGTGKNMGKYIEESEENANAKKSKWPSNESNDKVKKFKDNVKQRLSKLVDHLDVNSAADAMCFDFMANRLPPYGHTVPEEEETDDRKVPTLEHKIKIKYPDHVRVEYCADDEADDEDMSQLELDDEDEDSEMEEATDEKKKPSDEKAVAKESKSPKSKKEKSKSTTKSDTENEDDEDDVDVKDEAELCIKIVHSLNNVRETHMFGDNIDSMVGVLKLPAHFGKPAVALLEATDYIAVKDLELEEDDDKVMLAHTLYADDLIEVQS